MKTLKPRFEVPRRDPKIIAEEQAQHAVNPSKVATTDVVECGCCGVMLTSRYQQADEYEAMGNAILALDEGMAGIIERVSCNSKRYVFTIKLRPIVEKQVRETAEKIASVFAREMRGDFTAIAVVDEFDRLRASREYGDLE